MDPAPGAGGGSVATRSASDGQREVASEHAEAAADGPVAADVERVALDALVDHERELHVEAVVGGIGHGRLERETGLEPGAVRLFGLRARPPAQVAGLADLAHD